MNSFPCYGKWDMLAILLVLIIGVILLFSYARRFIKNNE